MELKTGNSKRWFIDLVSGFFILLWVYAATAKLLDYQAFSVQLGQSALLSAYAGVLVWLVPLSEYVLSGLLLFPKTKRVGLYGSLCLMTAFTTYIIIILNYADFVPCSCGGILESLGWTEHLIFNGVCLLLAATAFLVASQNPKSAILELKRNTILKLCTSLFGSSVLVIVLFLTSEEQLHRNNAFIRRYPHHLLTFNKAYDLEVNSYYFAGIAHESLYLGNYTAPLKLKSFDLTLEPKENLSINLPNLTSYSFKSIQNKVYADQLYTYDGSVPVLFQGTPDGQKMSQELYKRAFFDKITPVSDSTFIIGTTAASSGNYALGNITSNTGKTRIYPKLLEPQIDGVFDVNGFLLFNDLLNLVVYQYRYRNEYLLLNTQLELQTKGKLIDTIATAQLEVLTLKDSIHKLGPNTQTVAEYATTASHYLFIQSSRLGKYESEKMLDQARIVDVYDLNNQNYVSSFYLYDYKGEKSKAFIITGQHLFALMGDYLVIYEIRSDFLDLEAI